MNLMLLFTPHVLYYLASSYDYCQIKLFMAQDFHPTLHLKLRYLIQDKVQDILFFGILAAVQNTYFSTSLDTTCSVVASTFIARNLEEYVNMNSSNE